MALWTFGIALLSFLGDGVSSEFIPGGITRRMGGYRPNRAQMDKEADIVKKAPEDLKAPKFGAFEIGGKSWAFILDEPEEEGAPAKLFVDTNADGDLTNDPETKWEARQNGGSTTYFGSATIDLGDGKVGELGLYRFDPNDKQRAALKNTMMFYTDYGYEYTLKLDGEEFKTSVAGSVTEEMPLWIDRDKNGQQSQNYEMVKIKAPFNFTGTTYVLSIEKGDLAIAKADKELPQAPMPPNLSIGKPALTFTAKTMDGAEVEFPKSFAGKIVMLDFWATWCGPCIGEIPNMKEAYTEWHDKGFEILGVSFDNEGMEEKLKDFLTTKELPWAQIYEGKGWNTSIGQQHDVSGIPFVLLVDGDSGEILGTARQLRGPGLSQYIGKALQKKFPNLEIEVKEKEKEESDK